MTANETNGSGIRLLGLLRLAFTCLASLKLAVVLLVTLAGVIAFATILEAQYSRAHAQWFVYHANWFVVLLGLLGVNIFCAAAIRWPWKRHQFGFVVTHAGLLVLLAGSIQTFVGGVEGSVTLAEGESASRMTIPHRSQVAASWAGKPEEPPYLFSFDGGPVSWHRGTTLALGQVDGVQARVLNFIPHSKAVEDWIEDASQTGGPYVRFVVGGPHSSEIENFLSDQDFGDEIFVGPLRLHLERAASDRMLEDFLAPPVPHEDKGTLTFCYNDHLQRIDVEDSIGQKIPLGETGAAVEIVEYFANAAPDARGKFTSKGDDPTNPMVELRVHLPEQPPWRQLAFAKSPLLNLNAVHGRACPVSCRYYHAGLKPATAVELLQTSDSKLYCRVLVARSYEVIGEVKAGHRIELPSKFSFAITRYLPHARWKLAFASAETESGQAAKAAAAAEIEIAVAGVTQTMWLQRNHPSLGMRSVSTPQGELLVRFGYAQHPLDFDLQLVDFRREMNPGNAGNAGFSSLVRVVDKQQMVDEEREISMNQPLTHQRLTFYQSGFNDAGQDIELSTFSVAYDPGRLLKYTGSLMICVGIAFMFYMRAYFFKQVPRVWSRGANASQGSITQVHQPLSTSGAPPPKSPAVTSLCREPQPSQRP